MAFLAPADLSEQGAGRCFLMARYDVSAYRDTDFAAAGMAMPAFLSRAVPKRRAEFLAGRMLAAQALARIGQVNHVIGRGARGEPLWPVGVRGSLSHSHGTIGAWVGVDGADLGLDIEALADDRAARAIRHSVLTDADSVCLGPDPDAALCTAVFSAKEALYKALYPRVQRFFGFDHAQVVATGPAGLTLRLVKPLPEAGLAGLEIDIDQQWKAGRVISRCEIAP